MPLEDVSLRLSTLRGVVVTPRLVVGLSFECEDADNAGALQPDATVPSANRRGRVRAKVTGSFGTALEPNALLDLRGWDDLELDVATLREREDGTRLFRCLGVRGTVRSHSHGSRGVNAYKVSGRDLSLVAENGIAAGNVEQIILDYCEDLECSLRAVSFPSDNGIQLRGRAQRHPARAHRHHPPDLAGAGGPQPPPGFRRAAV